MLEVQHGSSIWMLWCAVFLVAGSSRTQYHRPRFVQCLTFVLFLVTTHTHPHARTGILAIFWVNMGQPVAWKFIFLCLFWTCSSSQNFAYPPQQHLIMSSLVSHPMSISHSFWLCHSTTFDLLCIIFAFFLISKETTVITAAFAHLWHLSWLRHLSKNNQNRDCSFILKKAARTDQG